MKAGLYGSVSIIVTKRNQRLGDLAGGTIVVRERRANTIRFGHAPTRGAAVGPRPLAANVGVDVTAITASELSAVRDFLARRDRLSREARARVAGTLAGALATKVGGLPPSGLAPEELLETIAAAKAASSYGSTSP